MSIVFKKNYDIITDDIKKPILKNNRGQDLDFVKQSCEENKEKENAFNIYMNIKYNIDLIQMSNDKESWDFVMKNNKNIHIEYKTIYLKGDCKYAKNINDVKIYDLIVIGKDKIDKYINLLEYSKKRNILKTFYYIVGFVYYNNDVEKIKYMYSHLDLYKISSVYFKQYGYRIHLTGYYDEKPHYQLPKCDFHLLKFFEEITKSQSLTTSD